MRVDNLDQALSETLHQEVQEEAYRIEQLEERVVSEIEGRVPRRGIGDVFRRMLAPSRGARIGQLATVGLTAVIFLTLGVFLSGKIFPSHHAELTPIVSAAANGENQVQCVRDIQPPLLESERERIHDLNRARWCQVDESLLNVVHRWACAHERGIESEQNECEENDR